MNAYEKSLQLGVAGTNEEIVSVLRCLTANPIELWQLREYFRQTQILIRGRNGWTGPLAAVESPVIDLLIDALDDPRQTIIDSDKPTWGPVFFAGLVALAPDLLTHEQVQQVLLLGGGIPFLELTEQGFSDSRAAYELSLEDQNPDVPYSEILDLIVIQRQSDGFRVIKKFSEVRSIDGVEQKRSGKSESLSATNSQINEFLGGL